MCVKINNKNATSEISCTAITEHVAYCVVGIMDADMNFTLFYAPQGSRLANGDGGKNNLHPSVQKMGQPEAETKGKCHLS